MSNNRGRGSTSGESNIKRWKKPDLTFILLSLFLIPALVFFVYSLLSNYVNIERSSIIGIVSIVTWVIAIAILLLLTPFYSCFLTAQKHCCLSYARDNRFWILLFLSLFLFFGLFVFFIIFSSVEVKSVEHPLYHWLKEVGLEIDKTFCLQRILCEASSIIGIAVAIVMGGITVATPLYLFLWQTITDSMFHVFMTARKQYLLAKCGAWESSDKDELQEDLRDLMDETYNAMKSMEKEMPCIRQIFGCSMVLSAFMLLMIVMVLISPDEDTSYIAATVCAICSLFLAAMFLYLVFRVWKMEAVRKKFDHQVKLAYLLSNDECR